MKGFFFAKGARDLSLSSSSFFSSKILSSPTTPGYRLTWCGQHTRGWFLYIFSYMMWRKQKRERERDWRSYLFPLLLLPFSPRFRVVSCQLRMSPLKGEWLMKSPTEGRRAWGKTRKRKKNNMPTTTLEFSSGRRGLEIRNKGRENWRVREEVLRHVFFSRRVTHATAQKVRGEKREKVRFPFLEKSILENLFPFL